MVKMLNAFTSEIDDVDIAVSEILSQLKIDENLLTNSIGIVACSGDFIETGVLKAICDRLPFSTIGMETSASMAAGECGQLILTVSVISSDDSTFISAISDELDDSEEKIMAFCRNASNNFDKEPKMIFALCPFNIESAVNAETIFNIINDSYPNIPVFGGTAGAADDCNTHKRIIFNGDAFNNRIVLAAFCGKIEPKFICRDISMNKIVRENGLVTQSDKNIICGINNIKFDEFLLKLGISRALLKEHIYMIPFWFDFNGRNEPISRAVFEITQDGCGICSGNIPTGITMALGKYRKKDVLDTAGKFFEDSCKHGKLNGVFILSCFGRFLSLEADFNSEMKLLQELFGETPFHLVYSAGEYLSMETNEKERNWHSFSIMGFCF